SAPEPVDIVDRSSGPPALRPPGAPTGGSAITTGGGSFGMLPSGRGTPGALGFCDGSNTSERRPVAGGGGGGGGAAATAGRGWFTAGFIGWFWTGVRPSGGDGAGWALAVPPRS